MALHDFKVYLGIQILSALQAYPLAHLPFEQSEKDSVCPKAPLFPSLPAPSCPPIPPLPPTPPVAVVTLYVKVFSLTSEPTLT